MINNSSLLLTAARVLSEQPNATLQFIADEAGISRTTIFNRYPTRDALLRALCEDGFERLGAAMQSLPKRPQVSMNDDLEKLTSELIPLGHHTMFLRNIPNSFNDLGSLWEKVSFPLFTYMHTAQKQGLLRADIPTKWLVASYISLLFGAWDEISQGELGPVQATRLVVSSWLNGAVQTGQ